MSETSTAEEAARVDAGAPVRRDASLLDAATDVWQAWVIAVVAALASAYFALNRGIWQNDAEIFYIIIFGMAATLAFLYGAYRVWRRATSL